MTNAPNSTDARDAEIAQLEAKGHVVLDIYNPRNHLCEPLASKVALLKGVFGIDDNGRCTRSPPPKSFVQQVFEYIMGGKIPPTNRLLTSAETTRKPRRPSIRKLIENAEKAGKPVTSVTTPDGTKLDFSKAPNAPADDEVENWLSKQKRH